MGGPGSTPGESHIFLQSAMLGLGGKNLVSWKLLICDQCEELLEGRAMDDPRRKRTGSTSSQPGRSKGLLIQAAATLQEIKEHENDQLLRLEKLKVELELCTHQVSFPVL